MSDDTNALTPEQVSKEIAETRDRVVRGVASRQEAQGFIEFLEEASYSTPKAQIEAAMELARGNGVFDSLMSEIRRGGIHPDCLAWAASLLAAASPSSEAREASPQCDAMSQHDERCDLAANHEGEHRCVIDGEESRWLWSDSINRWSRGPFGRKAHVGAGTGKTRSQVLADAAALESEARRGERDAAADEWIRKHETLEGLVEHLAESPPTRPPATHDPGVPAEHTANLPGQIIEEQAERIEELEGQLGASGVLAEGAKAQAGECGKRYFHETAHAMLECCREAGHPGCHEGYTGTPDQPRDCEWRWWDPTSGVLDPEGIEAACSAAVAAYFSRKGDDETTRDTLRTWFPGFDDTRRRLWLRTVSDAVTAYLGAARLDAGLRSSLFYKLNEMQLHDDTGDPRDEGYMAAVRELRSHLVAAALPERSGEQ